MSRKLHIGGIDPAPGWEILNALAGPHVDHCGDAHDLSRFSDNTFAEIYASHVLEHFSYQVKLDKAIGEWYRVLEPGGRLYVSVPDLDILARFLLMKDELTVDQRFHVMRMIFGGQENEYDYHYVGLNQAFLGQFLWRAGFVNLKRVPEFGIFNDASSIRFGGVLISLNVVAEKWAS